MNEIKPASLQNLNSEILRVLHDSVPGAPARSLADMIGDHLGADRVIHLQKTQSGGLSARDAWEKSPAGGKQHEFNYPADFAREADASSTNGALVCTPGHSQGSEPANSLPINGNIARALEAENVSMSIMLPLHNNESDRGYIRIDYKDEQKISPQAFALLNQLGLLISNAKTYLATREQLNNARQTCATVLNNVDIAIFATSLDSDEIVFANNAFHKVFGENCLGKTFIDCLTSGSAITKQSGSKAAQSGQSGQSIQTIQSGPTLQSAHSGQSGQPGHEGKQDRFEVSLNNGSQWFMVNRELICWLDGQQVCLGVCNDFTASKLYEESITRMAYQDHLTGLPNRYRCDVDLKQAIEDTTPGDDPGYVFFLDLDDFKIVNDCYGHDYGDGVLMAVSSYLRELFAGNTHVYRFGGDEFVVIIPPNCEKGVEYYLETMLERTKKPWVVGAKEFYCPFSIGVVEFRPGQEDVKSILKKADIAMYQTKKQGKNSYIYYTEGLDIASVRRSEMETLLRSAMDNDFEGFEVYYQPYINTRSRQIIGAEALVRLRGPDGKLMLPANFISLSEYLGLIVPLGEHVLRKASEICHKINNSGMPGFTMTVNLSYRQFQPKFAVDTLEKVMRSTGVDLSNMILSISEGAAINEMESMLRICSELRGRGVKIALDNFGSGHSTLIDMRNLPVDIIKVSSRYIASVHDDFAGYFVRMVGDLCRRSGKIACVSGVETEEQFTFCKKRRIEMVQGFLFHHPDSVDALSAILH